MLPSLVSITGGTDELIKHSTALNDEFIVLKVYCVLTVLSRTSWDNNFWLEVDYLQLASAALNVSSYFTCLLYVEVWAEITRFVTETLLCA